ncbi:cytochrome c [bacterium BMS3Bbin02]|nr:cytochrome c [bacterium BMS3Bbin02]
MGGSKYKFAQVLGVALVAGTIAYFGAGLVAGQPSGPPALDLDEDLVARGAEIYVASCAICHGANLQGVPNWKIPNEDGTFNPPPQDVSGHTWHHGDPTLLDIITNGGIGDNSLMPAFGGELTEEDMRAVLEFFRSYWGPTEQEFQRQATIRETATESP